MSISQYILSKLTAIAIILVVSVTAYSQQGVRFTSGGLAAVQKVAQEQGKNLLIDTYASWCIPCKRMDKVFATKKVGDFYNDNYITYKVNMDGPYGDEVRSQYEVVFLPTIIIVGPDGTVKYKVDREMSADELLSVGQLALRNDIQIVSDATAIRRNGEAAPRRNTSTKKSASRPARSGDEKIMYVLGLEGGDENPEYYKKEAYFRLELMDGSHKSAAKKYLATQTDWNTPENMTFVLDFVEKPFSKPYDHIIANKDQYYQSYGKDRVDNTLQILVYKHLYNGLPRPTLTQAQDLFTDLNYSNPGHHAHYYFITRSRLDRNFDEAYDYATTYLTTMEPGDINTFEAFLDFTSDNSHQYSAAQMTAAAKLVETHVTDEADILRLLPVAIKLLIKANECDEGKRLLQLARNIADQSGADVSVLDTIRFNCKV